MNGIFIRWLTLTGAILLTAYVVDGIRVSSLSTAIMAAAMLGIFNAFFRPIVLLLTLPINVLTLGLFTFVINALMLKMASGVISGFNVYGFWSAIMGSLLISVISWLMNSFVNDRGTVTYIRSDRRATRASKTGDDTIDLKHKGDDRWE